MAMDTRVNNYVGLRLVDADVGADVELSSPGVLEERRASIARENQSASSLSPADARWVLAVRTAAQIEGGRGAVLSLEKRNRLTRLATRLGLRPFDANLVIAIVQDGARSGQGPLGAAVAHRLELVRPPEVRQGPFGGPSGWLVLVTLGMAAGFLLLLVKWIQG